MDDEKLVFVGNYCYSEKDIFEALDNETTLFLLLKDLAAYKDHHDIDEIPCSISDILVKYSELIDKARSLK